MKHVLILVFLTTMLTAIVSSQTSPYAGQEQHGIKSLSPQEIEDYFTGSGMGFAKAAELNNYPGPKHVLELAEELELTEEQIRKTKELFQSMKNEAVRLGRAVIHRERELNNMFASNAVELNGLKSQTERIAKLQGELRAVHLSAHLAMKELLSAEQTKKYNELRGYSTKGDASHGKNLHEH